MEQNQNPPLPLTIGDGWSDDPAERQRQIEQQQGLVGQMAELLEDYDLDDFMLGDL